MWSSFFARLPLMPCVHEEDDEKGSSDHRSSWILCAGLLLMVAGGGIVLAYCLTPGAPREVMYMGAAMMATATLGGMACMAWCSEGPPSDEDEESVY